MPLTSVTVFQTIGGAYFISAAQSIFANLLLGNLPTAAPGVRPAAVVKAGAAKLHDVFPADPISGILHSYMHGLRVAFALCIALSGAAVVVSVFAEWRNIKRKAGVDMP